MGRKETTKNKWNKSENMRERIGEIKTRVDPGKKGKGKSKSYWPNTNSNWQHTNQTFQTRLQNHTQAPPPSAPAGNSYKPPPSPNPIKCNMSQFSPHACPSTKKPFCKNFHLRSCPGNCGRSHNCPYIDSNNSICNARPGQCNHRFQ